MRGLPMSNPIDLLIEIAKKKIVPCKWDDQPLQLIKIMANLTKGDIAEAFVVQYSKELGFDVANKIGRLGDYDVEINGKTFEVKMATEDISGNFQFNHICYDYKYNFLLCLGVSPADICFDIFTKADVATGKAGTLVTMGRGQNASFKLTKPKNVLHPIGEFKDTIRTLCYG